MSLTSNPYITSIGPTTNLNLPSNPYITSIGSTTNLNLPISDHLMSSPAMNLKIHKAVGGFVLEVINYGQDFIAPKSKLYIADETNIGSQIEKIMMLEALRAVSETH